MFKYKAGEGVFARGIAFWVIAGFAFLYARRLFLWLDRFGVMRKVLVDRIPVLGLPLTPGLLTGVVVFTLFAFLAWKLVNTPKIADLLVDTELEMKKVTWPSMEDTRKSSVVVIVCVAIMVAFLTLTDYALEGLFFGFIYGGANVGH